MIGRDEIPYQCQLWREERAFLEGLTAILPERASVINIGAWQGCSSIAILRGARDIWDFHLYSIDIKVAENEMKYVEECGLADPKRFTQIHGDSKVVGQFWSEPTCLVFVDGDHSQCLADILAWEPHIINNGYLVIHDYQAWLPSVTQAVDEWFAEAMNRGWRRAARVASIVAFRRGELHPNLPTQPDCPMANFCRGEI